LQIEDTLLSECERQALQAGADAVGWFAFGQGVWPKRG